MRIKDMAGKLAKISQIFSENAGLAIGAQFFQRSSWQEHF
jgi:hypothetical protein